MNKLECMILIKPIKVLFDGLEMEFRLLKILLTL